MSVFLDTNVLVYADDADAGEKTEIARDLIRAAIRQRSAVISTQVLQEYFVIARKKLRIDGAAARARVEVYSTMQVVTISPSTIVGAVDLHRMHALSFWDALVVRAAEQSGCDTLYSENLQPGRTFGPVRIVNPFPGGRKMSKLSWTENLTRFEAAEQALIREVVALFGVLVPDLQPSGGNAEAAAPEIRFQHRGVTLGFVLSVGGAGHHAFVDAGENRRADVLSLCTSFLGVPAAEVPNAKRYVSFPLTRLESPAARAALAAMVLQLA